MPRDNELYISDIIVSCEKILRYTKDMTSEKFSHDEIIYDAVVRNLIVIGEAAKNLPESSRALFQGVEWKKICGLRDIITHAYFGIDDIILWDIVKSKIPLLLKALKK